MTEPSPELARRERVARQAIDTEFDMEDEESSAALFVSFHLEEIEGAYWQQHFGSARPDPASVLAGLVLREHWGGEDAMENLDFTLPDGVTDYVIGVHFDAGGTVDAISMES